MEDIASTNPRHATLLSLVLEKEEKVDKSAGSVVGSKE